MMGDDDIEGMLAVGLLRSTRNEEQVRARLAWLLLVGQVHLGYSQSDVEQLWRGATRSLAATRIGTEGRSYDAS